MPRDWRIRVEDILESLSRIASYIDGLTYNQFTEDNRTLDAVIRNFGIIGEAANHVPVGPSAAPPVVGGLRARSCASKIRSRAETI
jgi:uncharacterized protein with HEPN domain